MPQTLQDLLNRGVVIEDMKTVPGAALAQYCDELDDIVANVTNDELAAMVGMEAKAIQDLADEDLIEAFTAAGVTGIFCLFTIPGWRRLVYGSTLDDVCAQIAATLADKQ